MSFDETYLREPELRGDRDEEGNYINGDETYRDIADRLQNGEFPPIFSWSDQEGTRLDIMMVYGTDQLTRLGEGQDTSNGLVVAMRLGMFVFSLLDEEGRRIIKHPTYVNEKLNLVHSNPIGKPLARLINGVIRELLPGFEDE